MLCRFSIHRNYIKNVRGFFGCQPSQKILVARASQGRPPPPSPGHPLKILFDHLGDFLNWGCLEITSRGRPNLTSKGRPWEVHSGCLQDVLMTSPRWPSKHVLGTMWVHLLDVLKFFLLFFQNLFNWQNLSKSNSILKVY